MRLFYYNAFIFNCLFILLIVFIYLLFAKRLMNFKTNDRCIVTYIDSIVQKIYDFDEIFVNVKRSPLYFTTIM